MLVRTHMEELKEHTNDTLYEQYRAEKLLAMGVAQDHSVFKEVKCVASSSSRSSSSRKLSLTRLPPSLPCPSRPSPRLARTHTLAAPPPRWPRSARCTSPSWPRWSSR